MHKTDIRYFLATLLVGLGTITSSAKAAGYKCDSVPGDPMHTRIYTLHNGLKIYLSVNKDQPRIQANIAVRTGSRNDPAETTGLAHYLEHLMFKGTQRFGTIDAEAERPYLDDIRDRYEKYRLLTEPSKRRQAYHEIDSVSQLAARWNIPNEYDKLMATIGSNGSNAFTSYDITCYVENIPSNEVSNWARIQADRFQNMVIRGFHTELEAVYEEYNIGLSSDGEKSFDALMNKLFPTHPYGTQTVIGTQEHLKNPSIVNIERYFKRYYCPNNVAIVMAGDLDPEETVATIDKYFGHWQPNTDCAAPSYPPMPGIALPVDTAVYGLEAENVIVAWRTKAAASSQADTLALISYLLSNGTAGLIDLNINQKMLIQSGDAGHESLADYGLFYMAGLPKEGQTLEEVRTLLFSQIELLKKGQFSEELLKSVRNNLKRHQEQSLEKNGPRATQMQYAFVNGVDWTNVVGQMKRLEKISKSDIVSFANSFFTDGYVTVFKRQGEDKSISPIDKPQITAIPTNRHLASSFVQAIQQAEHTAIEPRFVDFKRDMYRGKMRNGLDLVYKHNEENDLFSLVFHFPFGSCADKWLVNAAEYFDLVGSRRMSAAQVKSRLYSLACDMNISVSPYSTDISLSGLADNLPAAIALLEQVMDEAVADADTYAEYVSMTEKAYSDAKQEQKACFSRLRAYGIFGPRNSQRAIASTEELHKKAPSELIALIRNLRQHQHTVLFYGPTSRKSLENLLAKRHKIPRRWTSAPSAPDFTEQSTPSTEIMLAPYDAKNIYMIMYANDGRTWKPEETAVAALFNEYYGGGMNGVVFQELRESRGLAYSASAYATEYPSRKGHPMDNYTYIISQNDKMMDCISTFNQILDSIPVSEPAFNIAKQALLKRLASQRITRSNVLWKWLRAEETGIDYDIDQQIYEALPALTLQDMLSYGQRTMSSRPRRYLILGNEDALDMKSLEGIAPLKRLSLEDIFGY